MVGKQPILVNPNRCRNSEGKTKRRLTHRDNTFTPLVSKNGQYSERGKERRTTSRRYHQTKHSARFTSQRPRALEREYTLVAALIVGNRILGEKKNDPTTGVQLMIWFTRALTSTYHIRSMTLTWEGVWDHSRFSRVKWNKRLFRSGVLPFGWEKVIDGIIE